MLTIECPDGKIYPLSFIILYSVGLGLCKMPFSIIFNTATTIKLIQIAIPIFLFFIIINNIAATETKHIVPYIL